VGLLPGLAWGVVFLFLRWHELSPWVKYPLAFVEAMVVPGGAIFRDTLRH